jgi:iron complex transport system substrate-binding protein
VPRRRRAATVALTVGFALTSGCRDAPAWAADGWRPAAPPERIVAASVLAAEILFEIAPRQRIVGVHRLAADPRYSPIAGTLGELATLGAEAEELLAVRPDLVITDAFTKAETQALLEAAGVPLLRTAVPASFDDIAANVRRIARVCHVEAAGDRLVAEMNGRLQRLREQGRDLGAWRICSLDGAMHSHGRGSLFDALVAVVGATNLAAARGVGPFWQLDVETLLVWRPDALVIAAVPGEEAEERKWLHEHPGLRLLPCVQRDRIAFVPAALLGSTSPHLAGAAEWLQRTLRAWGRP